jgi:hypothetical protein
VAGVEFSREENRGGLEDLVGLPQPLILRLEPADLLCFGGRDPGPGTIVDLGLGDPAAQRLPRDPNCAPTATLAAVTEW